MFNRGNTQEGHHIRHVSVRLTLQDGTEELVNITTGAHQSLGGLFNGPDMFIEIEDGAGVSRLLSKTSIVSVTAVAAPRTDQLQRRLKQKTGTFNPYDILDVPKGADTATLQKAYREKASLYHPDRYASMELPKEMNAYIDAMARQVNMAWEEINKAATVN
ncbi:MAG: J domain-containing protein [Hyphomicrobiales bacterium]